jgi:hypothetical protein
MGTLLTLGANSSTPRRHGSGQNNEYITNTRGKLEHSIFCPLPCVRGVLEFAPSVSNVLIILSTSMSSWSARVEPSVSNALIILSTSMSSCNVLIILSTSKSSWSVRVGP